MWYIHLTEYYSDIKKSEVPLIAQGVLLSTQYSMGKNPKKSGLRYLHTAETNTTL